MSVTMESVSTAVGKIYEAAYDPERWLDAITDLRDLTGSTRACIMRIGPQESGAIGTISDPGLCSSEAYETYLRDPVFAAATNVPPGKIYRRQQIGDEGFLRRELWHDWFRPRDMYDGLVSNLLLGNGSYWFFDVQRGKRQPAFSDAEAEFLAILVPHLIRAGQIERSLGGTSALASAFAYLPFGILVVDGYQRVGHMNAAAETLLTRPASPLGLKNGHIAAADAKDAQKLQRLIADACSGLDGALPRTGGTLLMPADQSETGSIRLVLSIAPFPNSRIYGLASRGGAVIMIREAAPELSDDLEQHFSALFGLSPAEAALAAGLASGLSLKETAARNGVTFKTGRSYLERIFNKTGTHQQSHLVSLLNQARPLRPPGSSARP